MGGILQPGASHSKARSQASASYLGREAEALVADRAEGQHEGVHIADQRGILGSTIPTSLVEMRSRYP